MNLRHLLSLTLLCSSVALFGIEPETLSDVKSDKKEEFLQFTSSSDGTYRLQQNESSNEIGYIVEGYKSAAVYYVTSRAFSDKKPGFVDVLIQGFVGAHRSVATPYVVNLGNALYVNAPESLQKTCDQVAPHIKDIAPIVKWGTDILIANFIRDYVPK